MSLTYGFSLNPADNSADFSNALRTITGDGITLDGARFALTVNGFSATVGSGYALAAGRWLSNDEPLSMSIQAAGNNDDRTDALVIRVDYQARKAVLEILVDIDPDKLPDSLRSDEAYSMVLYFMRVRRGATSLTPDDITDVRGDSVLCGRAAPLSSVAGDVLYVYNFLLSGIDKEVARLIGLSDQVVQKANAAISELDEAIQKAGGSAGIGELMTSRHPPSETGWIACNGGPVPAAYQKLSALLGGTLPDIPGERYVTYIFGGAPMEV